MKLVAALAVAAAALVLPAANAAEQQRALGIDSTVLGMRLAWYDPASLTRLPGRSVPLASHAGAWSRSRDGAKLAIGGAHAADDLRFVDVKRMRVLGTVKLALHTRAGSVAWLRPN